MNVVYVAPFGLGEKTTVWARTLPMAARTASAGHRTSIVIPPWDTPADSGHCWRQDSVDLIHVTVAGGLPAIWLRMMRQVDRLQPHVVHIIKPRAYAGLVQWMLWQRRRWRRQPGPAILLDVDDWEQAWASINDYAPPVARFLAWQEEWGLRHADGITAASRWLVERAHADAPHTPCLYLPNGVSFPDDTPMDSVKGGASDANASGDDGAGNAVANVLFFTRFVEVDPNWLAAFWATFHAAMPRSRLMVAGNALQPNREAQYQAAMAALGDGPAGAVTWLGHVARETLPALYAATACAIFPAREEPLQQAKCSVRLATTLLYGTPVVASAVGEQQAYGAEGAAHLIDPHATPQDFARAVQQVVERPQARHDLQRTARQHLSARYDWTDLGQELVDFYERFNGASG